MYLVAFGMCSTFCGLPALANIVAFAQHKTELRASY